jgi:hypothetical protein
VTNALAYSTAASRFFRFNVASSFDRSGCSSDELKFDVPYVCPKSCNELSFESNPIFDDSMYRILPPHQELQPHPFFKVDRTTFQRRIECEGLGPYYQVKFQRYFFPSISHSYDLYLMRQDTQLNETQHDVTLHNDSQHNDLYLWCHDTQLNDTQHNDT